MAMIDALVVTGIESVALDESGYYSLITLSTDTEPVTIAMPPEFLGQLAEMALSKAPQVAGLGGNREAVEAFNLREGRFDLGDDGSTILLAKFGKASEIRFRLPQGGANVLAQSLQEYLSRNG